MRAPLLRATPLPLRAHLRMALYGVAAAVAAAADSLAASGERLAVDAAMAGGALQQRQCSLEAQATALRVWASTVAAAGADLRASLRAKGLLAPGPAADLVPAAEAPGASAVREAAAAGSALPSRRRRAFRWQPLPVASAAGEHGKAGRQVARPAAGSIAGAPGGRRRARRLRQRVRGGLAAACARRGGGGG